MLYHRWQYSQVSAPPLEVHNFASANMERVGGEGNNRGMHSRWQTCINAISHSWDSIGYSLTIFQLLTYIQGWMFAAHF